MRRTEVNLVPATRRRHRRRAFSMVELVTVILIIGVLMAIAIPTVSKVRRSAQAASVKAQISALSQAIENYHLDFRAYPGPISNQWLHYNGAPATEEIKYTTDSAFVPKPPNYNTNASIIEFATGTENLVLGLMGGLKRNTATNTTEFDPRLVGQGANSLNPANPKKSIAYYQEMQDLSDNFRSSLDGHYADGIVSVNDMKSKGDSPIPELLDRFPNRMPILYLRANVGAKGTGGPTLPYSSDNKNPVITDSTTTSGSNDPDYRKAQYDLTQIIAYTQEYTSGSLKKTIGEGKSPPKYYQDGNLTNPSAPYHGLTSVGYQNRDTVIGPGGSPSGTRYQYPYSAFPYFKDPQASNGYNSGEQAPYARQKDSYILISAGVDRIYGTDDDITNFGDVKP